MIACALAAQRSLGGFDDSNLSAPNSVSQAVRLFNVI
jgi:hypothetical protein